MTVNIKRIGQLKIDNAPTKRCFFLFEQQLLSLPKVNLWYTVINYDNHMCAILFILQRTFISSYILYSIEIMLVAFTRCS